MSFYTSGIKDILLQVYFLISLYPRNTYKKHLLTYVQLKMAVALWSVDKQYIYHSENLRNLEVKNKKLICIEVCSKN